MNDYAYGYAESQKRIRALQDEIARYQDRLRDKPGQPIQNAARALLRATDDAERNAALGDLYVLIVTVDRKRSETGGGQ